MATPARIDRGSGLVCEPVTPHLGAVARGFDFSRPMDRRRRDAVLGAMADRLVPIAAFRGPAMRAMPRGLGAVRGYDGPGRPEREGLSAVHPIRSGGATRRRAPRGSVSTPCSSRGSRA